MMNFDSTNDATGILEEVLRLIDEDYIHQHIEKRIEKVAADFEYDRKTPMAHNAFIRLLGDFISHIYENGLPLRQTLSVAQARAEAMTILAECYGSLLDCAYDAAFLDLLNSKLNGYEFILIRVIEVIKGMAKERHLKWVYSSRIISLDWPTRCQIAEILLRRWRPFLPPYIRQCSPLQFADHLPGLINLLRTTDCTVRNILNVDFDFVESETR